MTQIVTRYANVVARKDENIIFGTAAGFSGSPSSSAVTAPWSGIPFQEAQKAPSVKEINVMPSVLHQTAARAFEKARSQILQRASEWVDRLESVTALDEVEMKLGVEKEIVLHMPPHSKRRVTVRAKYVGPAKPQVVYDPLPEDE
jgi:hypothetical protein